MKRMICLVLFCAVFPVLAFADWTVERIVKFPQDVGGTGAMKLKGESFMVVGLEYCVGYPCPFDVYYFSSLQAAPQKVRSFPASGYGFHMELPDGEGYLLNTDKNAFTHVRMDGSFGEIFVLKQEGSIGRCVISGSKKLICPRAVFPVRSSPVIDVYDLNDGGRARTVDTGIEISNGAPIAAAEEGFVIYADSQLYFFRDDLSLDFKQTLNLPSGFYAEPANVVTFSNEAVIHIKNSKQDQHALIQVQRSVQPRVHHFDPGKDCFNYIGSSWMIKDPQDDHLVLLCKTALFKISKKGEIIWKSSVSNYATPNFIGPSLLFWAGSQTGFYLADSQTGQRMAHVYLPRAGNIHHVSQALGFGDQVVTFLRPLGAPNPKPPGFGSEIVFLKKD